MMFHTDATNAIRAAVPLAPCGIAYRQGRGWFTYDLTVAACLSAGDMNSLSGDEKRDLGQWLQARLEVEVGPFQSK